MSKVAWVSESSSLSSFYKIDSKFFIFSFLILLWSLPGFSEQGISIRRFRVIKPSPLIVGDVVTVVGAIRNESRTETINISSFRNGPGGTVELQPIATCQNVAPRATCNFRLPPFSVGARFYPSSPDASIDRSPMDNRFTIRFNYFQPNGTLLGSTERTENLVANYGVSLKALRARVVLIYDQNPLNFGNVGLNAVSRATFQIVNSGNAIFTDSQISPVLEESENSEVFSIESVQCDPATSLLAQGMVINNRSDCNITVRFIPTEAQVYRGKISLEYRSDNTTRQLEIPIRGRGRREARFEISGLEQPIRIDAATGTASREITITNTGDAHATFINFFEIWVNGNPMEGMNVEGSCRNNRLNQNSSCTVTLNVTSREAAEQANSTLARFLRFRYTPYRIARNAPQNGTDTFQYTLPAFDIPPAVETQRPVINRPARRVLEHNLNPNKARPSRN